MRATLRRRTTLLAVAAVTGVVALAGCGGAEEPDAPRPVATTKSIASVWKAYDAANAEAVRKSGPPTYDASGFEKVDTGPTLAEDVLGTRLDAIEKDTDVTVGKHSSQRLYAPLESDGVDHLIDASVTDDPDFDESRPVLVSMVRTGPGEPWKMENNVAVQRATDLPEPAEPGKASTPTKADLARAREVLDEIATYWTDGRQPEGVVVGPASGTIVMDNRASLRKASFEARQQVTVAGWYPTEGAGEAIRVVRTADGLLAIGSVRLREVATTSQKGTTLFRVKGTDAFKLFGADRGKRLVTTYLETIAVTIPKTGDARVLGVQDFAAAG